MSLLTNEPAAEDGNFWGQHLSRPSRVRQRGQVKTSQVAVTLPGQLRVCHMLSWKLSGAPLVPEGTAYVLMAREVAAEGTLVLCYSRFSPVPSTAPNHTLGLGRRSELFPRSCPLFLPVASLPSPPPEGGLHPQHGAA